MLFVSMSYYLAAGNVFLYATEYANHTCNRQYYVLILLNEINTL